MRGQYSHDTQKSSGLPWNVLLVGTLVFIGCLCVPLLLLRGSSYLLGFSLEQLAQIPDPRAIKAAKSAPATPLPPPETTREFARFLESAPPEFVRQAVSQEDRQENSAPDLTINRISNYTEGLPHAEAIERLFADNPNEPGARQQALAEIEQAGESGAEAIAELIRRLPSHLHSEQQRAADILLARSRSAPALAPKIRGLFAELAQRPHPLTEAGDERISPSQALWMYLQTAPPTHERLAVWQNTLEAQTDPSVRQAIEQMGTLVRSPATADSSLNP